MAYPRRLLSEGERIVAEFRPHWRMLFLPTAWTVGAIVAAVLVALLPPDGGPGDAIAYVIVAIVWLWKGLWGFVKWWFTWYVLTSERLITRRGVIAREGTEIPLERINDITFSQTILERILSSGDLLIESAGEQGQSRFADIRKPEDFQSLLYQIREERVGALQGGGASAPDAASTLEKLAGLHRDGAITDAEYEMKKRELLEEI